MRCWIARTALIIAASGCGAGTVHRPLVLDVQGLSGRAERVVVKVFPESLGVTCAGLSIDNVATLDSPHTTEWARASGAPRRMMLPEVDEPAVTVTVHTEDATGVPIQIGCTRVDFTQIESPEVSLLLE